MTDDATEKTTDLEAARLRLEGEQVRVQGLVARLRGELGDEAQAVDAELSSYDQHPADSASDTLESELDLSLLDQLEHELAEVEAALARVDHGTYGIDEVTGTPIDPERLEALPTARTNVDTDPPAA